MVKSLSILVLAAMGIFIVDQNIKWLFVDGYRHYAECIDLILVYNRGVAFSMFAFLEETLKWIQLVLLGGVVGYTLWLKKNCYILPVGIMTGAGLSNVYDRFIHGGVVDYVYWHCGFDFAVFNFADVMIDVAVLWLLIVNFRPHACKS
ncbi:signal peptidase II [Sulfuricurvum sp.]|uniref:signal peptidase II n=1 Tax=Sulfuricurvum sp. TaxID=2025608 RepID=UPI0019C90135|nr:signal peptidase II [Sulfuricurvum sp.]MBD3799299.1 lipoprotein signal peptidase [Campylobacterota bacterium]MBD3806049.1 lipoprotein signal peptidase [Sulfuricurvum sp.]